jgi:hypothetical protein
MAAPEVAVAGDDNELTLRKPIRSNDFSSSAMRKPLRSNGFSSLAMRKPLRSNDFSSYRHIWFFAGGISPGAQAQMELSLT